MSNLDSATEIRKGEELNLPNLEKYLSENLEGANGNLIIEQFPGGASNLTYLIKMGQQQMVLRRPPFGSKVKSAHDMGRENKVLSALSKVYSKAPKPLIYTEDESIIGSPFYIMERVHGVILRNNKGFAATLSAEMMGNIAESLVETMVELHDLNYQKIGLGDLGRPEGYVSRQVHGWTKRYRNAKTDDYPEFEKVAKWLADNIPPETGASIIHNDYKHDNVVLNIEDLTKIKAILDWEMCTVGDPLMDLGTTLAYWPNPNDPPLLKMAAGFPSSLPGNPTRSELIQFYAEKSGRNMDDYVFYFAYGQFKLAGVVQQIYYRYAKGLTQDKRFAMMNKLGHGMLQMALLAIEKNRIDNLF